MQINSDHSCDYSVTYVSALVITAAAVGVNISVVNLLLFSLLLHFPCYWLLFWGILTEKNNYKTKGE